jgi:hypothetical protein
MAKTTKKPAAKKGALNRRSIRMTGRTRDALWAMCEQVSGNPFEVMVTVMLGTRNQLLKAHLAEALAPYLMPKLASVKVQGDPEAPLVQKIEVTLE